MQNSPLPEEWGTEMDMDGGPLPGQSLKENGVLLHSR